jgi:hypothetical protein
LQAVQPRLGRMYTSLVAGPPVSIGVGVFATACIDIDRLISRTRSYPILTARPTRFRQRSQMRPSTGTPSPE